MKKNLTTGDKIGIFFFRVLFPGFHKEIISLNKKYRESQNAVRVKQNAIQGLERQLRQFERGK